MNDPFLEGFSQESGDPFLDRFKTQPDPFLKEFQQSNPYVNLGKATVGAVTGMAELSQEAGKFALNKVWDGVKWITAPTMEAGMAPFEAVGESLRVARQGGDFRAPTVIQRYIPRTKTELPPATMGSEAARWMSGATELATGGGLDKAKRAVNEEPHPLASIGYDVLLTPGGPQAVYGLGKLGVKAVKSIPEVTKDVWGWSKRALGKALSKAKPTVQPNIEEQTEMFGKAFGEKDQLMLDYGKQPHNSPRMVAERRKSTPKDYGVYNLENKATTNIPVTEYTENEIKAAEYLRKMDNERYIRSKIGSNPKKVYRGTENTFDPDLFTDMGLSVSQSPEGAKQYLIDRPYGFVEELQLKSDARILKASDIPKRFLETTDGAGTMTKRPPKDELIPWAKKQGYDAIDMSEIWGNDELRILKPKAVTKPKDIKVPERPFEDYLKMAREEEEFLLEQKFTPTTKEVESGFIGGGDRRKKTQGWVKTAKQNLDNYYIEESAVLKKAEIEARRTAGEVISKSDEIKEVAFVKEYTKRMRMKARGIQPEELGELRRSSDAKTYYTDPDDVNKLLVKDEHTRRLRDILDKEIFLTNQEVIEKQGATGKIFARMIDDSVRDGDLMASDNWVRYKTMLEGLDENEAMSLFDVVEGKYKGTPSPKLKAAAKIHTELMDDVARQIEEYNAANPDELLLTKGKNKEGKDVFYPWKRINEPYVPGVEDISEITDKQKLVAEILNQKLAKDSKEAEELIKTLLSKPKVQYSANLQHSRIGKLINAVRDPRKVMPKYIGDTANKIARINMFGAQNKKAQQIISQIAQEGGDANTVALMYAKQMGLEIANPQTALLRNLSSELTAWSTISNMTLSFASNMGSTSNVMLKNGFRNTLKAGLDLLNPKNRIEAERAGAIMQMIEQQVMGQVGNQRNVGEALRALGFTASEKFQRMLAATAGMRTAPQMASKLLKNPNSKEALEWFKFLDLDAAGIIKEVKQNGKLTEQTLRNIGWKMTTKTIGRTDPFYTPNILNHKEISFIANLKKIASFQSKFFITNVVKEAKRGNMVPLLKMAAFSQLVGEPIGAVKTLITGRERPSLIEHPFARAMSNVLFVQSLGLIDGIYQSNLYAGKGGVTATIAGVPLSMIGEGISAGLDIPRGKIKPAVKFAATQVAPYLGWKKFGSMGLWLGSGAKIAANRWLKAPKRKTEEKTGG